MRASDTRCRMPPDNSPGITVLEAVEPDHLDEVPRALDALRFRHPDEFERKPDIVGHGAPGECRFFLEHHADRLVRARNRLARNGDDAFVLAEQAADDVEERGLAAAGRADDGQEFARAGP